jgi:hypothetical protein
MVEVLFKRLAMLFKRLAAGQEQFCTFGMSVNLVHNLSEQVIRRLGFDNKLLALTLRHSAMDDL